MEKINFKHLSPQQNLDVEIINTNYHYMIDLQKNQKYTSDAKQFMVLTYNYLVYGLEGMAFECMQKIDPDYFTNGWLDDIEKSIAAFAKAQEYVSKNEQEKAEHEYEKYSYIHISMNLFLFFEKTFFFQKHPKFITFSKELFKSKFFKCGMRQKMYS